MKTFFKPLFLFSLVVLSACGVENVEKTKYALPDKLYSLPNYDDENAEILHPAGYLSRLTEYPDNDCEKEDLRRLVITMNMYAEEFHNQSYYIDSSTEGAQLLMSVFPGLKEMAGEARPKLKTDQIAQYLRGLTFPCRK